MRTTQIYPELSKTENEIRLLRKSLKNRRRPNRVVSLRGMGKLLVSAKELDTSLANHCCDSKVSKCKIINER